MNITIFRSRTGALIKQKLFPQLLAQLPDSLQGRAHRYQSELSAYNYVIGRLLLKRGLDSLGCSTDLEKIEFSENGKPILSDIYFNISHSDQQVICGLSKEGVIGIDLEKMAPIDFEDFTSMFSAAEWDAIKGADDSLRAFYWFWTRKESIIKALGWNLSYLHEIELDVSLDHFVVNGKRWFLREVFIEEGFIGSVCCEGEIGAVEVRDHCFLNH